MEEILSQILAEIKAVNGRVGGVENRLGNIENRVGSLEDRFVSMEGRVSGIEAVLQEHTQILRILEHRTDGLNVGVIRLEEDMNSLTGEVAAVRKGQEYLMDKFMEHDRDIWALKKAAR